MNVIMLTLYDRKPCIPIMISLLLLFCYLLCGCQIEPSSYSMNSLCEADGKSLPSDIIQIGENMYLIYYSEGIFLSQSKDGCNWIEISIPSKNKDEFMYSARFFETTHHQLGLVWSEKSIEKPDTSRFYISIYEDDEWSSPHLLFQREEIIHIRDAVMLDNGALLILWDEPHYVPQPSLGENAKGSGCDLTHRAYVLHNEVYIERVFEPESLTFCLMKGFGFIMENGNIWCIFHYEGEKPRFYRSRSEDGRVWETPEPFTDAMDGDQILITPHGEIGILVHNYYQGIAYLYTSSNWESWKKEVIFKTDDQMKGIILTTGEDNTIWGFVSTHPYRYYIRST